MLISELKVCQRRHDSNCLPTRKSKSPAEGATRHAWREGSPTVSVESRVLQLQPRCLAIQRIRCWSYQEAPREGAHTQRPTGFDVDVSSLQSTSVGSEEETRQKKQERRGGRRKGYIIIRRVWKLWRLGKPRGFASIGLTARQMNFSS